MARLRNSFAGKCPCRKFVPAGKGWVIARKIVCADCAAEVLGAEDEEREAMSLDRGDPIYGFEEGY